MQLVSVKIEKTDDTNFILGQTHFVKSVEDIHEALVLAETETGRGILGVVDGFSPKGVEDEGEIKWRKDFLWQIGYKL